MIIYWVHAVIHKLLEDVQYVKKTHDLGDFLDVSCWKCISSSCVLSKGSNFMSFSKLMGPSNLSSAICRNINVRSIKIRWLVVGIMRSLWLPWVGIRAMLATSLSSYWLEFVFDNNGKQTGMFHFVRFNPYLRDMIKNSKAWAQARGLLETNEVHGKEEWRIPTERKFEHTKTTGTHSSQEVSFTAEDHHPHVVRMGHVTLWFMKWNPLC